MGKNQKQNRIEGKYKQKYIAKEKLKQCKERERDRKGEGRGKESV